MCQSAFKRIFPDKKYVMKYTTVGGIDGFDGTRKEAPKAVVIEKADEVEKEDKKDIADNTTTDIE